MAVLAKRHPKLLSTRNLRCMVKNQTRAKAHSQQYKGAKDPASPALPTGFILPTPLISSIGVLLDAHELTLEFHHYDAITFHTLCTVNTYLCGATNNCRHASR